MAIHFEKIMPQPLTIVEKSSYVFFFELVSPGGRVVIGISL